MIKKIKQWIWNRRFKKAKDNLLDSETYSREQMEHAYQLGYNDGKRDGLAIARHQATNSLKEILSWQNENQPYKKK